MAGIDTSMEALNNAWQAASQDMYNASQQSGDAGAAGPQADGQPQGNASDNVTDVDFEEVKEK